MADRVIGIDLGTTNSAVAVVRDGRPALLPLRGDRLLPSVVGLAPGGELLVGAPARNQWVSAPERTVRSIKRRMGSGEPVDLGGRSYTPQEVSAFILREMKAAAEAELGERVERAVVTVPAYFDEVQRQATLEAGEIAGLVVERILNEPTAAALAYGYGRGAEAEPLRVLVYDLGGGTFDVSIIELSQGVVDVLATAGDNHLGGDDFDERIATRLAEEFGDEHDVDVRQDHQAWARLLRAAEEAKIRLSDEPVAPVALDYLATAPDGTPLNLQRHLERAELEELIADLLERTDDKLSEALADGGLAAAEVDRVLLVGGSTRIPAVWDLVARRTAQDPLDEIDPDAAVALGAAVQGAIIAGEDVSAILVDVTPLSLGVETARRGWGGRLTTDHFSPLVRRNTTIPVRRSERFSTVAPGQDEIHVKVYQGESPVASENTLLGDFRVTDLQPDDYDGLADILIDFALDVNGILDVTVTDRTSRRRTRARLQATRRRMSPDDIARSREKLAAAGPTGRTSAGGGGVPVVVEDGGMGIAAQGAVEAEARPAEAGIAGGGGSGDGTPPVTALDPGVAALVDRARRVMDRSGLEHTVVAELRDAVTGIRAAAATGDAGAVEERCDLLIDLLLDLEG